MFTTRIGLFSLPLLTALLLLVITGCPWQSGAGASATAQPPGPAPSSTATSAGAQTPRGGEEASAQTQGETADTGRDVSAVKLELADGTTKTIADYAGKVLVLDFWATFCKPCIKKLSEFQDLQEELDQSVAVVAVTLDPDVQTAVGWAKASDMTLPIAQFSDEMKETFFPGQDTIAIPQTRIINQQGKLAASFGPEASFEDIEKTVRELGAGQK
ncbi:MAG: TlpA family protein disulfide reductase [Armatimonadetes bacterium]|nr:TlpA family protein disulfide reductase [Armatimonadota bacterium]